MTANQFRAALSRLELSQLGAARLFGADGRTARRWALGERSVPPTVALLLRLMIAGKIKPEDIEAVQMTSKPPRIDDAPGLTWRPRVRGRWEARWQARAIGR